MGRMARGIREKVAMAAMSAAYRISGVKHLTGAQMIPAAQNNKAVFKEFTEETAIKEGYKSSVYVYKCIDKIGKAAGSVPWKVYRLTNGTWEPIEQHPLELLMERPNEYMDRSELIEIMTAHLYLSGNSLHTKVRGVGSEVIELWPVQPKNITPVKSTESYISHYEFKEGTQKALIDPADIIHTKFIDPENTFWGMGPLMVAARIIDTDNEAVSWNKIGLQNRGIPDGALTTDQELSDPVYNETKGRIREQLQGARNARNIMLLSGGFKYQQMSLSPVEMDFINSRKMTKEEICSAFDVPPPIVGIMDNSIYNNMSEARQIFWEDTVIPYLNKIRQVFNQALATDFQKGNEKIFIDYDLTGVQALRKNDKEQVETVKSYWAMGVPFNALNKKYDLGFEDIEGGDTGFIPSGVVPADMDWNELAGEPVNQDNVNNNPDNEDENPEDENTNPDIDDDNPEDEDQGAGKPKGAAAKKTVKQPTSLKGLNLNTPQEKAMYWKSTERRRIAWYAKTTKGAKQLFAKEGQHIAKLYKDKGQAAALDYINGKKNTKAWGAFYLSTYKGVIAEFGANALDGLKAIPLNIERKAEEEPPPEPEPLEFDPWDENIQAYIIANSAQKVTKVLDFTRQTIAAIISEMMEAGASTNEIARAIRDRYDDMGRNRSFTIARTEVASASNYGIYAAGKQAEPITGKLKKVWIESGDERVRDSHQFKEVLDLDEPFKNGLMYPGDMAGPGKEVIKCRCTMAYRNT